MAQSSRSPRRFHLNVIHLRFGMEIYPGSRDNFFPSPPVTGWKFNRDDLLTSHNEISRHSNVVLLKMLRNIILIVIIVAVKGDECIQLSFGKHGNVCVCNATYCDTIEVPQLQKDQFLWYSSTKDGKMMEYSINNFSIENKMENETEINVLSINSNQKYQQIFGFGGAMTDAAALNIRKLSNDTQHKLLESYFGSTGIGYTYCRIPIAGTDFSTRSYTYDDTPGDVTLSNFSLVEEDNYKIQYLQHIKNIMPDSNNLRIFTTSWSAPAWMKITNNTKWGTLKFEYYQLYANYIKKFFDAYKERDINIWGLTPGNEPINGINPFFTFNAMLWTPSEEANWSLNYLSPTLSKAGYKDIVYMAMDDQRFELPWYPDIMFSNQKVKELFSGIAVHWYSDFIFSPDKTLTKTHNNYPDKFLLMTEASTGVFTFEPKGPLLGSWNRGEQYMTDIIENLSHWVSGWIDWNLALDETGGPNWTQNYVDSAIIVIPQKDQFYKQPMFYAISHFSKFVPRDSYVISSTEERCSFFQEKIKSIAFLTPEQKIVVVIVNKNDSPVDLIIKDKSANKIIDINLPPKSFHTISYLA